MKYERLRQQMVDKFVVKAGITDKLVISSISEIPRHLFVEPALAHQAYDGRSLPIGFGQTISHPTTVALMSQCLEIQGGEKILEVGTGSGYQAAVLAKMGAKVYSIERIADLVRRAQKIMASLGYFDVLIKTGDGSVGWTEYAPFDRIIVTAGAPSIPETFVRQLSSNGKLIMPVGDKHKQKLKILIKLDHKVTVKEEGWQNFVPLIGRKGWYR
jgi:protein-L-isoaspartate(D-aspartate) O-methyltransferase